MTPGGGVVSADHYNQIFTLHGAIMIFLFIIPATPRRPGQLLSALDDRRARCRFPATQSGQPFTFTSWAPSSPFIPSFTPRSIPAGRSTPPTASKPRAPSSPWFWAFSSSVSPHFHGHQLHRHHASAPRPRHDLVPDAPVRLGPLRPQHHPGAGHSGSWASRFFCWRPSGFSAWGSSTPASAAIPSCSSISSGFTRIRRSTS